MQRDSQACRVTIRHGESVEHVEGESGMASGKYVKLVTQACGGNGNHVEEQTDM